MKNLVIKCKRGHAQRIEYDARYSRDEIVAHGVIVTGGTLKGITSNGEPLTWPAGMCQFDDTPSEEHAPCGEPLFFTIEDGS